MDPATRLAAISTWVALDRATGYAVTQITDDGFLRVYRIGRGSRHPLWDQAFEAGQVRILTTKGSVAGVLALPDQPTRRN